MFCGNKSLQRTHRDDEWQQQTRLTAIIYKTINCSALLMTRWRKAVSDWRPVPPFATYHRFSFDFTMELRQTGVPFGNNPDQIMRFPEAYIGAQTKRRQVVGRDSANLNGKLFTECMREHIIHSLTIVSAANTSHPQIILTGPARPLHFTKIIRLRDAN
jgi:hypothetical protein